MALTLSPPPPLTHLHQVNDAVEHYAEEWRLKDSVVRSILNAKGSKKVSALAGALRTMLFMQRYESELQVGGWAVRGVRAVKQGCVHVLHVLSL